jgi:hypothetical protein
MKIPNIIINPPDWLAVILSAALGAAGITTVIALREVVKLIQP